MHKVYIIYSMAQHTLFVSLYNISGSLISDRKQKSESETLKGLSFKDERAMAIFTDVSNQTAVL